MPGVGRTLSGVRLDKIAIIVDDYDQAIAFFTGALGFDLVEDSPSLTNDGRAKRWVVVRPPGGDTGILLAQADGERQAAAVGNQTAGRVGFFLEVDDFDAALPADDGGWRRIRHRAAHRALRPGGGLHRHRRQSLGPARPRAAIGVNSRETFHYIAETVMLLNTCKMRGGVTRGQPGRQR